MDKSRRWGQTSVKNSHRSLKVESEDELVELLKDSPLDDTFSRCLPNALLGDWEAVKIVCSEWSTITSDLVLLASEIDAESVRKTNDHWLIRTSQNGWSEAPLHHFCRLVADAPFHPWIERYGWDIGTRIFAVDSFRILLPGFERVHAHASSGWPELPEGTDEIRFRRLVDLALRSSMPPIVRIAQMFQLNETEIGAIFGVTRQAVSQWQSTDVPAARLSKLSNILAVGELLERKLRPDVLPLVARRTSNEYGGRTMIQMMEDGLDAELLNLTERTFDWAATA